MQVDTVSVSVVIPCFNSCSTVERAVKSVLTQTVMPQEIILVDDGSVDNTVEVLERLASQVKRDLIRVIVLDRNYGPSVARNTGWNGAKCRFVAFLDSDDVWLADKIKVQYAFMDANTDICISGHCRSHSKKRDSDVGAGSPSKEIRRIDILLSNVFETTSTIMVSTEVKLRFQSGKHYSEDYYFVLRLILSGCRGVKLQRVLTRQFKRPYGESGLSSSLVQMEKGELETYSLVHRDGLISLPTLYLVKLWSLLKFIKRVFYR